MRDAIGGPGVPLKDAPPGYQILFSRWTRRWTWRQEGTGRRSTREGGFDTRDDANDDAYADLRARRQLTVVTP